MNYSTIFQIILYNIYTFILKFYYSMGDFATHSDGVYLQRLIDVENTLKHVDTKVDKIYIAVIGNEKFDQKGIIDRLKKVEVEVDDIKSLKMKMTAAFAVGGALWTIIWELIRPIIFKG